MFDNVFIIAEASSNHNGNLETALELVRKAKQAGADAIKFQDYTLGSLFSPPQYEKTLKIENSEWQADIKRLEFRPDWHQAVANEAQKHGIVYFSTPFSIEAVDRLDPFVPFYKISSGDITFFPLLEKVGEKRKGVFISTGASRVDEIDRAVSVLQGFNLPFICVMHCIMLYPAPPRLLNLNFIDRLKERYGMPVGFSDHSLGPEAAPIAVAKGVRALEKHFTLDNRQKGADHSNSADPEEFAELVRRVRSTESMLGPTERRLPEREKEERVYARRGIYTTLPIEQGEEITYKNVTFLRPNISIGAERIKDLLNKPVNRAVEPLVPLDPKVFDEKEIEKKP